MQSYIPIWQTLGRPRKFDKSEQLWETALEYFKATDQRVWTETDWVGKDATEVERVKRTPYTIAGFCVFIGVSRHWWNEFRKVAEEDFLEVFARIEDVMFAQKFEGAAVGAFNATIIARDLGLTDKKEIDATVNAPLVITLDSDSTNQETK
jgi:hypothetical protein